MPTENEIQLWMPHGSQGQDNLPSIEEYIAMAIRNDGALPNTISDCKTYNKVLYQLTRVARAIGLYINTFGKSVLDSHSSEQICENFIAAFRNAVFNTLNPENPDENNPGYNPKINYVTDEIIVLKNTPPDTSIKVLEYDVGLDTLMVYFDGILISRGSGKESSGTPVWYETGSIKTVSNTIKFKFDIPMGTPIRVVRYGELQYKK